MVSVLSNAGQISLAPYPHIVIPDCLPPDLFAELDATFPERKVLDVEHRGEGVRVDLHSRDALKILDGTWREFIALHTSAEFWKQVVDLFGDAINLLYPMLRLRYGPFEGWSCSPRGVEATTLRMECQPGVNTPQRIEQRVRGPHLDNPVELFGGMLYMGGTEGGDLQIQRLTRGPRFHGKLEIKDKCVETVATVPYKANMFVLFINSPVSIHSVTPRPATDKCRRLINFIGEVPEMLFKTGHGEY